MLTEGFLKVHSKNVKCGHLVGNTVVNPAGREVKIIADDSLDVNSDPVSIRADGTSEVLLNRILFTSILFCSAFLSA